MRIFVACFALITLCLTVSSQPKTDWFNEPFESGISAGAEVDEALRLIGDQKLEEVIVAVIDDGVDIHHSDLHGKIWVNEDEIPDNGLDDDQNGYIDDIHGWNFLGNPNGENIKYETLEITRLLRSYSKKFRDLPLDSINKNELNEYALYLQYKATFEEELKSVQSQFAEYAQLANLYQGAVAYYYDKTGEKGIVSEQLMKWRPETIDGQQIKSFLILAEKEGLQESIKEGADYFQAQLDYNFNLDFDPRSIVNESDFPSGYGNNIVYAESPDHGTHVAGIIAAKRSNGEGIDGIAPNAKIMTLRAIPSGDERDKDVAYAIRYAVDNGARIINMSFGKPFSPQLNLVNEAIQYAIKNNVLLVHAAGNDSADNDKVKNYPDGTLGKKRSAKAFLTIAASSYSSTASFLPEFSNFGENSVDFAAPGVEIRSLKPENGVKSQSGTSMAAPVVSGVAALVLGLEPDLKAQKVKKLLLATANEFEFSTQMSEDSEIARIRYPACISAERAIRFICK
ncbi:MAG: S8 family serine peptidase [Flavobacteriales bacterium]|nr:S8 family serine peptidase [Flavobacteriales bacterium]